MLQIFISISKRKKLSGDQLHGKQKIIKWVSPSNMKKREEKMKINKHARQKSERIRKSRFPIHCKLNVLNLPQNSISMEMLISTPM